MCYKLIVAMTRPKRHLCIIGDSETVSRYVKSAPPFSIHDIKPLLNTDGLDTLYIYLTPDPANENRGSPFLKRWMSYLEENADLRYPNAVDLT